MPPSSFAGAFAILEKYGLVSRVPASVRERLEQGVAGELAETPKAGDPLFRNVRNVLVGNSRLALDAAARRARELGYRTLVLSSEIQGETREIARMHAAIAREIAATGRPVKAPACIVTGGETTVTLRGDGLGGRNQEFVLAAALDIAGLDNVVVLSAGRPTAATGPPTPPAPSPMAIPFAAIPRRAPSSIATTRIITFSLWTISSSPGPPTPTSWMCESFW